MHFKVNALALIALTAFATSMTGQTPTNSAAMVIGDGPPELLRANPKAGMVAMQVEDMDTEPVKGAPFCATIATAHTQAFADGNHIHTTENSTLCRDSEGRTRREAGLNLLGAASQGSMPNLITIVDPVAGFHYMLDSESKIAHRMAIKSLPNLAMRSIDVGRGAVPERDHPVMIYQSVGAAGPNMVLNKDVFFKKYGKVSDEPPAATESLGDQMVEGVHATGTRITTTIAAGKMGNEQPILVTSERWYSPELKATVMTKHNDPWSGELKTQFTNVNTSEPDSSLFSVPGDYKVVDDKGGQLTIQKRLLAPPPAPQ